MKRVVALLVAVVVMISLSSCGQGKNALVGKWDKVRDESSTTCGPYYLYFYSDGTYGSDDSDLQGTYSVDGDSMRMEKKWANDLNVTFKVHGNKLEIEYWYGTNVYERVED